MARYEIETLTPLEHVRKRSDVYVGDCSDATHLLIEAIGNSVDEFNAGYGSEVFITIDNDNHIYSIMDYGRGFPVNEMRDDWETSLQASFDVLNTGAKYREDGTYAGISIGRNGQGCKLINFLSHSLYVCSWRNGEKECLNFAEGVLDNREEGFVPPNISGSGTFILFNPSEEFFTSPTVDLTEVKEFCDNLTCLCKGLAININGTKYEHPDGILELLSKAVGNDNEIVSNRLLFESQVGKQKISVGMSFTEATEERYVSFVNCGLTTDGQHITTIKTVVGKCLNRWAKVNGLIKGKDKSLDGPSIREGIVLVSNITAEGVMYNAQVKQSITKIDTSFITQELTKGIDQWLNEHPDDAKSVVEKAILAKKASDAAKKAREAVKNKAPSGRQKVKIMHPDKLKDAEFLGENSTLLLVEGNSGSASMALARDTKTYGILSLKGKIINAFSNTKSKILANEEVQLLFQALGLEQGEYNPNKLRYGRIGITTDADSDGYHIGLLIMCAIYQFFPKFIEEGRLCWLRSPLYIVKYKDHEEYYFTDEELAAVRGNIKGELQRNKGIGSLSPSQAKNSMFGTYQRMDVLRPTEEAYRLLKDLMGNSVDKRYEYIFNNIDFQEVRE